MSHLGLQRGTTVATSLLVSSGARLPFAAVVAGLLLGAAAPARGPSQAPTSETAPITTPREEAPAIDIIEATPTLTAPIPDQETPPPMVRVVVHRPRTGLVVARGPARCR